MQDHTGRRLSVNEVLDAYQTEHAEVKAVASDRQEYGARHLRRLLSGAVTDIGIPECRDYVKKRKAEGAAASTVRRELNILTAAANHARRWKRLTVDQMPQVEVHIVPSDAPPTGAGEPGVPPIGPAVANAVYQATKKRVRVLPFSKGLSA